MQQDIRAPRSHKLLRAALLAMLAGEFLTSLSITLRAEDDLSPAYTIVPKTALPAPDGSGKNRTVLGIGEKVYLQLVGKSLGDPGKIKWNALTGREYLDEKTTADGEKATLVIKQVWIPKNAFVTICATTGNNNIAQITFDILSPDSIISKNKQTPAFELPKGRIGASNQLELRISPLSVCFNGLKIRELDLGIRDVTPPEGSFQGKTHILSSEKVPVNAGNHITRVDLVGHYGMDRKTYLDLYGSSQQSCYYLCGFLWYPANGFDGCLFTTTQLGIVIGNNAYSTQVTKFNSCVIRSNVLDDYTYSK